MDRSNGLFLLYAGSEARRQRREEVVAKYGCIDLPNESFDGLIALCEEAAPKDVVDKPNTPGNKVFKIRGGQENHRRFIVCEPRDLVALQQELKQVLRCAEFQARYPGDEHHVSEIWEVVATKGDPGPQHIDARYSKRGVGGTIAFHGSGWNIRTEFFTSAADASPRVANVPAIAFDGTSLHRSPKGTGRKFERGRFFFSFVRGSASKVDIDEFHKSLETSYFKGFEHLRLTISVRDTLPRAVPPMQIVTTENCLHSAPVVAAGAGSKPPRGPSPISNVAAIRKGGGARRKDGGGRGRGIIQTAHFTEFELGSMCFGKSHHSEAYPGLDFHGPSQHGRLISDRLSLTNRYTDEDSCALDALEEACRAGLNRQKVGVADGPVRLMSVEVQRVIQSEGFVLKQVRAIVGKRRKQRGVQLSLQRLFGQKGGVYLAEFQWRLSPGQTDWHCVAINCCPGARYVFCNALGYLPFSMGKPNESAATHDQLASLFHINCFPQCWQVLKALPRAVSRAD